MIKPARKKNRRWPRRGDPTAGFTMIELLMTMLLLTVVLLGLAALQIGTIRRVTASRRANEATRLALSVLERYRHIDCSMLPPDNGPSWTDVVLNAQTMANVAVDGVSAGPYTVQEWVEDVSGSGTEFAITIRATWTSQERTDGTAKMYQSAVSLRRICTP